MKTCERDEHQWWVADWRHVENRPSAVANETRRVCEVCRAEWYQIEVSHFDQPLPDGSSRITVEPSRGLVLPTEPRDGGWYRFPG